MPPGREVTLPMFAAWCERHRQTLRLLGELDAQALFEEFRGVIGAQPAGPLSLADYLALGTRQSLLNTAQRELAHGLFQRYRAWLADVGLHDSNLLRTPGAPRSHRSSRRCTTSLSSTKFRTSHPRSWRWCWRC